MKFSLPNYSAALKNSILDGIFYNAFLYLTTPFLIAFAISMGASNLEIGIITASGLLGGSLARIPLAEIVERIDHRKSITIASNLIAQIGIALIGLIPVFFITNWFGALISFILITNFFMASSNVAWNSWMSGLIPKKKQGHFFGDRYFFNSLSGLIALLIAGAILAVFNNQLIGFQILFIAGIIPAIISSHYLAKIPSKPYKEQFNEKNIFDEIKIIFANKNYLAFLVFSLVLNFGVYFPDPFFTAHVINNLHAPASFIAIQTIVFLVFCALTYKQWGKLADKYGDKSILTVSAIGVCLIPLCWAFTTNLWEILLLEILTGVAWAGFNIAVTNYLWDISDERKRAMYVAIYWGLIGIVGIIAPLLGGLTATALENTKIGFLTAIPIVFLIAFCIRLISLPLLAKAHEAVKPKDNTIELLRYLINNIKIHGTRKP